MPLVDRLNYKKYPVKDYYRKILVSRETAIDLGDNRTFPVIICREIVYTSDSKGLKTKIGERAPYR
jgi:hypothetical protein